MFDGIRLGLVLVEFEECEPEHRQTPIDASVQVAGQCDVNFSGIIRFVLHLFLRRMAPCDETKLCSVCTPTSKACAVAIIKGITLVSYYTQLALSFGHMTMEFFAGLFLFAMLCVGVFMLVFLHGAWVWVCEFGTPSLPWGFICFDV